MILLFGKGRHSFHKANVTDLRRLRGEKGEDWLVIFQNGDNAGVGIDLRKYEWAYTIGSPFREGDWRIEWYKGEPGGWKTKAHPDCL